MNKKRVPVIVYDIILLILVVLVVIVSIRLNIDFFKISFEKKVSFSDVTNLVIALAVSAYLPYSFGRILEKKKGKKELFSHSCNELKDTLKQFIDIVEPSEGNPQSSDRLIFVYIGRVDHLVKSVIIKNAEKELKKLDTTRLNSVYKKFRSLATDEIRKTTFSADKYFIQLFKVYLAFDSEIERIKFEINSI